MEDGALRGPAAVRVFQTREAAPEDNTGRLGSERHMPAKGPAGHFEDGRFAAAGTARENYELRIMADLFTPAHL